MGIHASRWPTPPGHRDALNRSSHGCGIRIGSVTRDSALHSAGISPRLQAEGAGHTGTHGVPAWAVYGVADGESARQLVQSLWLHLAPVAADPLVPWLAVATDGSRTVAAASRTLGSGFFYHLNPMNLVIATDPGRVLSLVGWGELNVDYLHRFACLSAAPADTAYQQVHRVAPGRAAVWRGTDTQPTLTVWCGARNWPAPSREGDSVPGDYLATFDHVVSVLNDEPSVVAMSSGLDSTFLAASVVGLARTDHPVTALVHRPLAQTPAAPRSRVLVDEFPLAAAMSTTYGARLRIVGVVNEQRVHPLDAALLSSAASWLPAVNPHNAQWHHDFAAHAAAMGAGQILVGAHGNAAFSHHHAYAGWHYLLRGHPLTAMSVSSVGDVSWPRLRGLKALARQPQQMVKRTDDVSAYAQLLGITPHPALGSSSWHAPTRSAFLRALGDEDYGYAADGHPASSPVRFIDPFTAAPVLDFAASMTPREWRRREARILGPRGYARLLMRDRVPDAIRLSNQVGMQGADAWTVVRTAPQRLRDVVERLDVTPIIRDCVDGRAVTHIVNGWNWNDAQAPAPRELVGVLRIAHLAEFIDMTARRLSELAPSE